MTSLNLKNFAQLVEEGVAAIQGRCSKLIDFSVGSVLRAIVEANAGMALWLQSVALKVLAATRAATSTGEDLDSFVADYGMTRLSSQFAIGAVTFSRFTPAVQAVVPVGATVQSADGAQNFVVVADPTHGSYNAGLNGYVVPSGIQSVAVPVKAVVPGIGGNIKANTIGYITSQIDFIDTAANLADFAGGGDAESDADLRARFRLFIASLSKATPLAVGYALTSMQLGVEYTLIEHRDYSGAWRPGHFCVVIDDGTGEPSDYLVSQALSAVELIRAAGVNYSVHKPVVMPIDVSVNVSAKPGYDVQTVKGAVATALTNFIEAIPLGEGFAWSKIAQIAYEASPGVANCVSIQLNQSMTDILPDARVSLTVGTVTVN